MNQLLKFIGLSFLGILLAIEVQMTGCQTKITQNNLPVSEDVNSRQNQKSYSPISEEEYQIYSYLINNNKTPNTISILIDNKTTYGSIKPKSTLDEVISALRKTPASSIFEESITDFQTKNRESYEITDKFNINYKYTIGEAKNEEVKPYGVKIRFSRVGYDEKRETALVYFEEYSGIKSAFGKYIFLQKIDGNWTEQNYNLPNWVSYR